MIYENKNIRITADSITVTTGAGIKIIAITDIVDASIKPCGLPGNWPFYVGRTLINVGWVGLGFIIACFITLMLVYTGSDITIEVKPIDLVMLAVSALIEAIVPVLIIAMGRLSVKRWPARLVVSLKTGEQQTVAKGGIGVKEIKDICAAICTAIGAA